MIRYIILVLCCISFTLAAQNESGMDSVKVVTNDPIIVENTGIDTVLIKSYSKRYDPRKALLYAAVFPGLGQIYNKKYWKLPLIYGGAGALIYAIDFNQEGYTENKLELFKVIDGGSSRFSEQYLRNAINFYRRQRDFYIIMTGLVYILQIVDAHVDAHLKEFDLNPKLQVRLEPMLDNDPMLGRQTGFSFYIKF